MTALQICALLFFFLTYGLGLAVDRRCRIQPIGIYAWVAAFWALLTL